jgi:predicted PurR-regulated permease PerM
MTGAQSGADPNAAARSRPVDRGFVVTLVAATAIIFFLYGIRQILPPFVAAGIIAFVCQPLIDWIAQQLRAPRALAAVLVFLGIAAIATALAILAGPPIVTGLTQTITNLPSLMETLAIRLLGPNPIHVMGQTLSAQQISAEVIKGLQQLAQASQLLSVATVGVAGAFAFLLSWVLLFYFLVGGPKIGAGLVRLLPPAHRDLAVRIWARLQPVLRRYFVGIVVVVAYASVAAYIGLGLALKIHHAVLLAIMTGLFEMLPVIGPGLAAVVAGLAAVQQATSATAIVLYIIYATCLRLSIDQLIGPIVLGRAARLHPTAVIFCFLSGGLLFGIAGVIMAVPVALTIKVVLSTIYGEASGGDAVEART